MSSVKVTLVVFLTLAVGWCEAQSQLVLLNKEKVLARFSEGQAFTYRLKKSKDFVIGYIVKVNEFSVVTSYDTIPFSKIDAIALKGHHNSALNLIGSAIFDVGVLYFVLDELNSAVVNGQGYDNDRTVWEPALIMAASGLALRMIRKRSQKLRYPAKLLAAPKGSPFWRPE